MTSKQCDISLPHNKWMTGRVQEFYAHIYLFIFFFYLFFDLSAMKNIRPQIKHLLFVSEFNTSTHPHITVLEG